MWAAKLASMMHRRRFRRPSADESRGFIEEEPPSIQVTTTTTTTTTTTHPNNSGKDPTAATQPAGEQHRSMPLLFNLCRRWAWPAVEFRCQSHPHEANARDRTTGETAMHWVVFGKPPVGVIEALLRACPDLASVPNGQGQLPLHLAASYRASSDVLRALVQAYPEAAVTPMPKTRSLVLHVLCDVGTSVDGIRAILEANAVSVQKCDGVFRQTPLQILNARKSMGRHQSLLVMLRAVRSDQDRCRRDLHTNGAVAAANLSGSVILVEKVRQCDFWLKAALLVQAEYKCSTLEPGEDPVVRIVHACAGIRQCPPSLLELASLLYPSQLLEQDEEGEVPLHKAATHSGNDVLYDVFTACPDASAICDKRGRYPLHLAVKAGRRWRSGVGLLVAANPVAVEGLDLDSRLYPLLWSHLSGINSLFLSIQSKPNLFSKG